VNHHRHRGRLIVAGVLATVVAAFGAADLT